MKNPGRLIGRALVLALIGAAWTPLAIAQQPASPKDGPQASPPGAARPVRAAGGPETPISKEALRDRLQRRLAEARDSATQLEEAINQLDKGASPEDVRRMLPERGGQGRRDRDDSMGPGEGLDKVAGGPGSQGRQDRPLTDEERQTVREILGAAFPEMLKRLDELSAKDPEAGRRRLSEMHPRVKFLFELKKRDSEMYTMRLEEIRTAREAVAAGVDVVELRRKGQPDQAAMTKLRTLVVAQLDARMAVARRELQQLLERIEAKRTEIEQNTREREDAIERQMKAVLERAEKPPSPHGGRPGDDLLPPPGPGGADAGRPGEGGRRERLGPPH